jgi:hypothetical protein
MLILKGKPGEIKQVDNLTTGPIEIRILAIENGEVQFAIGPGPRRSYALVPPDDVPLDIPAFLRKQAD